MMVSDIQLSSSAKKDKMKIHKLFIAFTALFGVSAVIIGSLSAHAIDKGLSIESLQRLETGLEYQFYHVVALLGVGILASLHRNSDSLLLKLSGLAFITGILLFSGSLYIYAITGDELFGKVTPFGGIFFIFGWLMLFFFSFRK
jgi:uncharacterized membrane protein YgdD (TMEM256/DUF423 family)